MRPLAQPQARAQVEWLAYDGGGTASSIRPSRERGLDDAPATRRRPSTDPAPTTRWGGGERREPTVYPHAPSMSSSPMARGAQLSLAEMSRVRPAVLARRVWAFHTPGFNFSTHVAVACAPTLSVVASRRATDQDSRWGGWKAAGLVAGLGMGACMVAPLTCVAAESGVPVERWVSPFPRSPSLRPSSALRPALDTPMCFSVAEDSLGGDWGGQLLSWDTTCDEPLHLSVGLSRPAAEHA